MRSEAVKGGLRTALADPTALYKACEGGGPNVGKELASPQLATPVKTTCYVMNVNFAEDETKRPYGVTTTQANVPLPPYFNNTDVSVPGPYKFGVYPGSGQADANAWHDQHESRAPQEHDLGAEPAQPCAEPAFVDAVHDAFRLRAVQGVLPGHVRRPHHDHRSDAHLLHVGRLLLRELRHDHRRRQRRRRRRNRRRLHHRSGGCASTPRTHRRRTTSPASARRSSSA